MRRYELMVILDPDLEEKTVAPSLETYLKIIKDGGGKVNKLDIWGKRRMSFEINKKGVRGSKPLFLLEMVIKRT